MIDDASNTQDPTATQAGGVAALGRRIPGGLDRSLGWQRVREILWFGRYPNRLGIDSSGLLGLHCDAESRSSEEVPHRTDDAAVSGVGGGSEENRFAFEIGAGKPD